MKRAYVAGFITPFVAVAAILWGLFRLHDRWCEPCRRKREAA